MTTSSYKDIFCNRLKEARTAKKLSQKKLGILAGLDEFVASTRINRYEKGVHEADINTIQRLSKILDTPVPYFFTDDDCLAYIIINFNKLSSSTKKTIHQMICDEINKTQ